MNTDSGAELAVYEWQAWKGFLITRLAPEATRIEATVLGSAERVLRDLPASATSLLFHIDCTFSDRFPRNRAGLVSALKRRGIAVLNGGITDISKRRLQATCVRAGLNTTAATVSGPPEELVIVKTNLNSAGLPERYLTWWQRAILGIRLNRMISDREGYLILARADVPVTCWTDPTLAIERYVFNREGVWFRAYLFRDRLVVSRARCARPIRRMYHGSDRTNSRYVISEGVAVPVRGDFAVPKGVLDAIVTLASEVRLDFGTMDIVCDDDGSAFIVDLNVTPFCRDGAEDIIEHLRATVPIVPRTPWWSDRER
jgi:hypothetical protein